MICRCTSSTLDTSSAPSMLIPLESTGVPVDRDPSPSIADVGCEVPQQKGTPVQPGTTSLSLIIRKLLVNNSLRDRFDLFDSPARDNTEVVFTEKSQRQKSWHGWWLSLQRTSEGRLMQIILEISCNIEKQSKSQLQQTSTSPLRAVVSIRLGKCRLPRLRNMTESQRHLFCTAAQAWVQR